ncbi:TPA: hypothetical protein ACK3Q6_004446 [Burkholderia cepacia]
MGLFDRFFQKDTPPAPAHETPRPTAFELNRLAWIVSEERLADHRTIPATADMVSSAETALRARNITTDERTAAVRLAASIAQNDFLDSERERPIGNPFMSEELRKAYDDRCDLLCTFEDADQSASQWDDGDKRDHARNLVGEAEFHIDRSEPNFERARELLTEAVELEIEHGGHAIRDALAKLEQYEPAYSHLSHGGIVPSDHRSTYAGEIVGASSNNAFQETRGQTVAHPLSVLRVSSDTPAHVRESLLAHGSNVQIAYPHNGVGHITPLNKRFQPTTLEPLVSARQMKENGVSSANLSRPRESRGMKL